MFPRLHGFTQASSLAMRLWAATNRIPGFAWGYVLIVATVGLAHGSFWTRGVLSDDLCMCEAATSQSYWDAVQFWLRTWNSRLFLALTQIGTYHLPWFARPLEAPWFVLHGFVVFAHASTCCLLLNLLSRAGLAAGPALAAVLVLAIHPVAGQSVLWLAGAYGYVFGSLLTVLAVWAYLEYERTGRRRWLIATVASSIAAVLGIEQFLPVLGALSFIHALRSRWYEPRRPAWVALAVVGCCTVLFLVVHFGMFPGTGVRLAHATTKVDPVPRPGMLWHLAWWLSLVPEHSPWAHSFGLGLRALQRSMEQVAMIAAAILVAVWRMASPKSWPNATVRTIGATTTHYWVIAAGLGATLASLLPFAFTGYIGLTQRNAYVVLPGLLVAGAAALDALATRSALERSMRYALAPLVGAAAAMSLVIDVGAQANFALEWQASQVVIALLQRDADAIRAAGKVELIITSPFARKPYVPVHPWLFPCLVRWVVRDHDVGAWIGTDPPENEARESASSHRIFVTSR